MALDIATETGWAMSTGLCGIWKLKERNDESGGMRFVRLAGKLRELKKAFGLELVVYEDLQPQSGKKANSYNTKVLIQLIGAVRMFCEEEGVLYEGVPLATIKSHAMPGRHAPKEEIFKAAQRRWGAENIFNNNVADAMWLLDYAMEKLVLPKPWPPY